MQLPAEYLRSDGCYLRRSHRRLRRRGQLRECTGSLSCGGNSGSPLACGCLARTCADVGAECGAIDDGCGNSLACGSCEAGTTCGGGAHQISVAARRRRVPTPAPAAAKWSTAAEASSLAAAAAYQTPVAAVATLINAVARLRLATRSAELAEQLTDGCGGVPYCGTCAESKSATNKLGIVYRRRS